MKIFVITIISFTGIALTKQEHISNPWGKIQKILNDIKSGDKGGTDYDVGHSQHPKASSLQTLKALLKLKGFDSGNNDSGNNDQTNKLQHENIKNVDDGYQENEINEQRIENDKVSNHINDIIRCDGNKCVYINDPNTSHSYKKGLLQNGYSSDNKRDVKQIIVLSTKDLRLKDLDNRDTSDEANTIIDDELYDYINKGLNKRTRNKNKINSTEKRLNVILDKFAESYDIIRDTVIEALLNYVKGDGELNKPNLNAKQITRIERLKQLYRDNQIDDNLLKQEINQLFYGKYSNTKLYYHKKNDNVIYVPNWLYENIALAKSATDEDDLSRGNDKPELVHRRNIQDATEYGLPFELHIQGLGQTKI